MYYKTTFMEFKNTLEVLHSLAKEIGNITAKLEHSDDVSLIELDLLLEKLRNIYDLTMDLRVTFHSDYLTKNKKTTSDRSVIENKQRNEEMETTNRPVKPTKENVRERVEKDLASKEKEKDKTKTKEKFVSDRFKDSKLTLHDEISGKSKHDDISSQYKSKPISNISNALGLNEKFELINHLFDGDKETFEHTLELLDNAGSFVEAYNYLEEHFKWDMDDVYVQRILELIRRKLIVHRNDQ